MSDYIPKNTYNSLKRRVWLAESKSTRNTFWALDDNSFKIAIADDFDDRRAQDQR